MDTTTTPATGAHKELLAWLESRGIEHEVHEHTLAYTAMETARAEGVDPHSFAKVVGIETDDGRRVLLVVDATDHVSLTKASRELETRHVRLLEEAELTQLAPGCDAGAIPAVGELFGVPMLADFAVRDDRDISFNAGTHRYSVRVDRAAWEKATGVKYADLASETDMRPAWARS